MNDKHYLVDTNILVYAYDSSQGKKHKKAKEIVQKMWLDGGVITLQNLQEFFVVVTKKVRNKISMKEAREIIEGFVLSQKWLILEPSIITFLKGMDIHIKFEVAFWDAQIIAVALANGISKIISEDRDFAKTKNIKAINPFK